MKGKQRRWEEQNTSQAWSSSYLEETRGKKMGRGKEYFIFGSGEVEEERNTGVKRRVNEGTTVYIPYI